MAISFPRSDIISAVPYEDQSFKLQTRQEYSRTAGGRTIGKDLGPAIWVAQYTTSILQNDDAVAFEAALNSLDGVINVFEAGDLRRKMPRSDPDGTGLGASLPLLRSVNTNNKALSLSGLPAAYRLSAGDFLAFDYGDSRALHQVVEAAAANGGGVTGEFEVRPHIRQGWSLDVPVTLKNPLGRFSLMPDSIDSKLSGSLFSVITFQAVQVV